MQSNITPPVLHLCFTVQIPEKSDVSPKQPAKYAYLRKKSLL